MKTGLEWALFWGLLVLLLAGCAASPPTYVCYSMMAGEQPVIACVPHQKAPAR